MHILEHKLMFSYLFFFSSNISLVFFEIIQLPPSHYFSILFLLVIWSLSCKGMTHSFSSIYVQTLEFYVVFERVEVSMYMGQGFSPFYLK
jgi:hypothetical protein